MGAVRVTLVCVALGGCAGDVCIDGVCANPDEHRPLPGPCFAHQRYGTATKPVTTDAVYTYDRGLLVHIDSTFDGWTGDMAQTPLHQVTTIDWSYDSARELAGISGPGVRWTFDAQAVTHVSGGIYVCSYDRTTFAFLPHVSLLDELGPRAELGLASCDATPFSWNQDGDLLTRVGANRIDSFNLDAHGNIVRAHHVSMVEGSTVESVETWTFDDRDHPVEYAMDYGNLVHSVYRYDQGGNLIEELDKAFGHNTIYSYDCW